ncbi:unnamed protein product [Urochloa humidicola]
MAEVEEAEERAPTWAEAQAMEKRLSSIRDKIRDLNLYLMTKDDDNNLFSGRSDAEREAKKGKAEEERLLLIREYVRLSSVSERPDFSGMTEAERAAEAERLRREALEEARRLETAGDSKGGERLLLIREYVRLSSVSERWDHPDFSGMTEAERAAEAERFRQEALEEARRLETAGDSKSSKWREAEARILDFDPKRGGIYFNRCATVYLPTFDHDEERVSRCL